MNEVDADQYELFGVETVGLFGSFNDASRETAVTASGRNLPFVGAMFFLDHQFRKRLKRRNLDIEFSQTEAIQPIPDPDPQLVYRRS